MDNNMSGNYYSKIIITFYLRSIAAFNTDFQKYWFWLIIFTCIITILPQVAVYAVAKNAKEIAFYSVALYQITHYEFSLVYLHYKGIILKEMLELEGENFYSYSNSNLTETIKDNTSAICKILLTIILPLIAIVVFLVVFATMETNNTLSDTKVYSFNDLFYPAWYPWWPFSYKEYIFTYWLEIVQAIPLIIYVYLQIIFIWYFQIKLRTEIMKLCSALKNIEKEVLKLIATITEDSSSNEESEDENEDNQPQKVQCYMKNTILTANERKLMKFKDVQKKEYNQLSMNYLKECIKHHQKIIKFVNCFTKSYRAPLTSLALYTIFTLSSTCLFITKYWKEISSYLVLYVFMFFLALSSLFIFCYIGESLIDANDLLSNTLYEIDWFNQSLEFQKHILFIKLRCQRGLYFRGVGSFIAGYPLFTSVIRMSYSLINVLFKVF